MARHKVKFEKVDGSRFHAIITAAIDLNLNGHMHDLTPFNREEYERMDCYVGEIDNGWCGVYLNCGFAIEPTTSELVSVFSEQRGIGNILMREAVKRGAKRLNCFAHPHLLKLYKKHGFKETNRVFNWTPGQPDVVWMRRGKYA